MSSTVTDVVHALSRLRILPGPEKKVQEQIHVGLLESFPECVREFPLDDGVVDIWVPEADCAVEIKTKGSVGSITRQCGRYARSHQVKSVVLATTARRIAMIPRFTVEDVPVIPTLVRLR